jgi:hypothetical protein
LIPLGVAQVQDAGERGRGRLDAALLEPGVVLGADLGEQGDLFAAQPGHPARRAVVGQPDRAEAEFAAPCLEEFLPARCDARRWSDRQPGSTDQ